MKRSTVTYIVLKAAIVSWFIFWGIKDGVLHHRAFIAVLNFALAGYFTWSTFSILKKTRDEEDEK